MGPPADTRSFAQKRPMRGVAFVLLFVLLGCPGGDPRPPAPKSVQGTLDLQNWDLQKDGPVSLSGEWEFYWRQHYDAADFARGDPAAASLIQVPKVWNDQKVDGRKIPGEGHATYRLRVLLGDGSGLLALKFLDMASAFSVEVNGSAIAAVGVPGRTPETTVPEFKPQVVCFQPDSRELEIIVRVSNYHHARGGMWEPVLLGTEDQIRAAREKAVSLDLFLFGSILIIGIYHAGLFSMRREEKTPLYFALFCLLIAARMVTTGERMLISICPSLAWEVLIKIPYLAFYLAVPVFAGFIQSLFPQEAQGRALRAIVGAALVFAAVVLFTPARVYSHSLIYFQVFTLLACAYGIILIGRAALRGREGARAFLIGFLVLIAAAVNDILYANQAVATGYWFPLGFLIFIFFQAFFLSTRFSKALRTVELQREDLIKANAACQREIGARIKTAKALVESENKYRTMFQDSLEPMSLVQDGKILDANAAWLRVHGYEDAPEVFGRDVVTFIHPDDRPVLIDRRRRWPKLGRRVFQVRDVCRDGSVILVEGYSSRILLDGREVILTTIHDITERKRAEEENYRLQLQLQQAEKLKAIGTLAGGIAHDFNNCLAAIMGYAELSRIESARYPHLVRNLDEILKASNRAKNLVKQILSFSSQTVLEYKPVRVDLLLQETLDLLRATLPASIAVQSFVDQNLPLVQSDPTQIHQVIMNLCTNAQHAMEESGGVLSVGLTRFTLTRDQSREFPDLPPGLYLRLDVRDTGDGIDPGIMDRIYDPFFTTKGSGKGSGMGLSVVHGIVKSHAGSIHIRSTPGAGTIVQVLLPAVDIEVKAEGRTVETVSMGNERILLVDDEEPLALLGKQVLERLGYDVTALTNPLAALEAFRKSPERYDLVVTDRTMPVLSGFHLAAELKRIRPAIPIILCTGFVQAADEQQASSSGISRIILKPLETGELARAIRQSLVAGGDSDPAIKAAR